MNKYKEEEEQLLDDFQLRHIQILTHLMANDAIDDEVVENLRKSELDYFALLNKYHLLEQKVNIDEKTNLLKYKKDYLTEIIKTASRIYFGTDSVNYNVSFIRFDIDDFSLFNNSTATKRVIAFWWLLLMSYEANHGRQIMPYVSEAKNLMLFFLPRLSMAL